MQSAVNIMPFILHVVIPVIAGLLGAFILFMIIRSVRHRIIMSRMARREEAERKAKKEERIRLRKEQAESGAILEASTTAIVKKKIPVDEYEVETCDPKSANAFVFSSAMKGGLHFEHIEEEDIPEGSQPWFIEWVGQRLHFLVRRGSELSTFEPGDEILQYPGDLLGTIQAKEIKEFFKIQKSLMEKIAFWALVVIIGVSLFVGFIVVTSR